MYKAYIPFLALALSAISVYAHGQYDSTGYYGETTSRTDSAELSKRIVWRYGIDSTAYRYGQKMTELIRTRQTRLLTPASPKHPDAYCLRMALPPTFYSSSILQQFSTSLDAAPEDVHLVSMYLVNDAFANMYVNRPGLVVQTDSNIKQAGTLRKDVQQPLTSDTKLSDKVVTVNLDKELDENVELVTRKPNFWKFPGSGSLQFTQNYFSENWHKGGDNNYAMQGFLTLNANYDNKQKIQWENKLEAQLGFQTTSKSDKYHSMKPTNNLLRLTTKLGYKAYKTLYYTTQVQVSTQIVPAYDDNTNNLRTAIFSPMDMTVSVGLDYKFATKNNKFNGNAYLAPCAYNMRYVKHDELVTRYGVEQGKHAYHKFGPNITVNYNWQIAKNISWNSRIYWISNFEYTNIEWENTFKFAINKYLNATLFANPKFDDSSPSYKGDHGYLMMREWFSLGLGYNW
ncbi:MAG: DUF3078 domain-containing protein [Bacteroides sp.]|nr:DUF3078 domain-containing protein [Bacteroides sp.]MCM1448464.1 DUF3078 domain-containing protein [Bacteroides sp.]MCM1516538.1 DUF3078 domain-containing protein [Paraprevotella sp.]